MNLEIAGGEVPRCGVTVTQADREEVIVAGRAIVGHVNREADRRSPSACSLRSGEMSVVSVNGQTGNIALVDGNV